MHYVPLTASSMFLPLRLANSPSPTPGAAPPRYTPPRTAGTRRWCAHWWSSAATCAPGTPALPPRTWQARKATRRGEVRV
eukprot:2078467-Pyramimonas_sp.AAC.1